MNSTVSRETPVTTSGHQEHPPQQVTHEVQHQPVQHQPIQHQPIPHDLRVVRRLTWLDRAALHLGVALIRWGRRPAAVDARDHQSARAEHEAACRERERAMERMLLLNASRRW